METTGARILEARKQKGFSQRELAELLGITVQAISQWENNRTEPTGRLRRLADILGVSEQWLTQGDVPDFTARSLGRPRSSSEVPLIDFEQVPLFVQGVELQKEYNASAKVYSSIEPQGQMFAIMARSDDKSFNAGDMLIFDNGIQAIDKDVVCLMVLETPYVQLMKGVSAFPDGHVSIGVGQVRGPGDALTPLLNMSIMINGEAIEKAVVVVGVMVERRIFRTAT